MSGPFSAAAKGVRVAVRLQPGARADGIDGVVADASDATQLKVRVRAVPEKGAANKALIKLLAKSWRVAQSDLELVAGSKDRNKTIVLHGEPAERLALLRTWLGTIEKSDKKGA